MGTRFRSHPTHPCTVWIHPHPLPQGDGSIPTCQWKIWSPQRMLGNDIAVFMREFGAAHSLQQWVLAHDASSSISTSNSHEQYGIPKSDEFLSLVKFDMWFCDSFVHLPDSKSIHWQNRRCHRCAHCEVIRFLDAFSYCQCFSFSLTTYSDQKPSNLCQEIL